MAADHPCLRSPLRRAGMLLAGSVQSRAFASFGPLLCRGSTIFAFAPELQEGSGDLKAQCSEPAQQIKAT